MRFRFGRTCDWSSWLTRRPASTRRVESPFPGGPRLCLIVQVMPRKFLVWTSICVGILSPMMVRRLPSLIGAAVITAWGLSASVLPAAAIPSASAQPCPDTQVVFARGTGEEPGVGPTGQAFVDALRGRLGGKSLDVYAVNYPASDQWSTGLDGIRDTQSHILNEASACPNTKMVLGGYSQGAAVAGGAPPPPVPPSVAPGL